MKGRIDQSNQPKINKCNVSSPQRRRRCHGTLVCRALYSHYSNQQGSKSRQNPCQVQPPKMNRKFIRVKTINHVFGYQLQCFLLCLTCRLRRLTVWSLIFIYYYFSNYRVCVDVSGSFYFSFIFHNMHPFGWLACDHGRRSRQLDQYGC